MTAELTEKLTVELPARLVRTIETSARRRNTTPSRVVAEALGGAALPDIAEVERYVDDLIERMSRLPHEELESIAKARLSPSEQRRLSALLAANSERELTSRESAALDRLMDRVQALSEQTFVARWLLGEFGPPPPSPK